MVLVRSELMKVAKLLFLQSMALVLFRSEMLELAKLLFWHSMALVLVRTDLLELVAFLVFNQLELVVLAEDKEMLGLVISESCLSVFSSFQQFFSLFLNHFDFL